MNIKLDGIESAGWLLLDVAEFLGQGPSLSTAEKSIHNALRTKISRQLRQQEREGDPLQLVSHVRDMLAATTDHRR
ncbi:MAG: hypothetical protein CMJ20_09020 [Phycisphaeraceae bacterium]|nr:hypothetical protein [Phycisphaeraceae bacterium]